MVFNYDGDTEKLYRYKDGVYQGSSTHIISGPRATGSGVVAIGRKNPAVDAEYASVGVDELLLFDAELTADEAQDIAAFI